MAMRKSFSPLISARSSITSYARDSERPQITKQAVNDLKNNKMKIENQKRQLRSKTVRLRKLIADREVSIKRVLSETKENQKIQTASSTTIGQLKRTAELLVHTRDTQLKNLSNIQYGDQGLRTSELEVEIRTLFQEQIRLEELYDSKAYAHNEARENLEYARNFLGYVPEVRVHIGTVTSECKEYLKKLESYHRRQCKVTPTMNSSSLKQEIRDLIERIEVEKMSAKQYQESFLKSSIELDKVIQEASQLIEEKLTGKSINK